MRQRRQTCLRQQLPGDARNQSRGRSRTRRLLDIHRSTYPRHNHFPNLQPTSRFGIGRQLFWPGLRGLLGTCRNTASSACTFCRFPLLVPLGSGWTRQHQATGCSLPISSGIGTSARCRYKNSQDAAFLHALFRIQIRRHHCVQEDASKQSFAWFSCL